jgi:ACR3 family arsenite efflux pump ArsB
VFLKLTALVFQAVLPAAMVIIIAHLTAQWVEYSFAVVLVGFASIIAISLIWRLLEWFYNLAVRRYTDNS